MVVCFLDGLYLDATLPLHALLIRLRHALTAIFYLLVLLLRLYYINAWCILDYGESATCVTWVCGG